MYIYVLRYIHVYMYIFIYIHTYTYIYIYIYIYMYICIQRPYQGRTLDGQIPCCYPTAPNLSLALYKSWYLITLIHQVNLR